MKLFSTLRGMALHGFACYLLSSALFGCAISDARQQHSLGAERRLLPFVEASQVPMSGGIWISDHEVAFGVRKPGVMELSQAQRNEIQEGNDPDYYHWDYTRWSEVWILDIHTGKTRKYMDGALGSSNYGEITVILQSYRPRNLKPGLSRLEQGYSELSEGRLGEEKRRIKQASPIKYHPDKCPGEPETNKPGLRRQLQPEHGCLDIRNLAPIEQPALYYRSDGKVTALKISRADIGGVSTDVRNWVEWLSAYLLKNDTMGGYDINGVLTTSIYLMKPDGSLLAVPLNTWGIQHIRPTRAGIAGDFGGGRPWEDGLYLWRNGEIHQISEGYTRDGRLDISYSPDGCKVSYRSSARRVGIYPKDEDFRLRVIDLCKALHLPPAANPFVWPEVTQP